MIPFVHAYFEVECLSNALHLRTIDQMEGNGFIQVSYRLIKNIQPNPHEVYCGMGILLPRYYQCTHKHRLTNITHIHTQTQLQPPRNQFAVLAAASDRKAMLPGFHLCWLAYCNMCAKSVFNTILPY